MDEESKEEVRQRRCELFDAGQSDSASAHAGDTATAVVSVSDSNQPNQPPPSECSGDAQEPSAAREVVENRATHLVPTPTGFGACLIPGVNINFNILNRDVDLDGINMMVQSLVIGIREGTIPLTQPSCAGLCKSLSCKSSKSSVVSTVQPHTTCGFGGRMNSTSYDDLSTRGAGASASVPSTPGALTHPPRKSLGAIPKGSNWREQPIFPDDNHTRSEQHRSSTASNWREEASLIPPSWREQQRSSTASNWREEALLSQPSSSGSQAAAVRDSKNCGVIEVSDSEDFFASDNESKGTSSSDDKRKSKRYSPHSVMAQMASFIAKQTQSKRGSRKVLTDSSRDTDDVKRPPSKKPKKQATESGKRKSSEEDDDPNKGNCGICYVKPPDCLLRCRHAYCQRCLEKLKLDKKPCPKCNKKFRTWDRIYL